MSSRRQSSKRRPAGAPKIGRDFFIALAIAACAWLLYSQTLSFDFVYDARAKVLMSPFIHDLRNLPDLLTGRILARDELDNNRPGNLLSLMIDSVVWGKNPTGYHATSITVHAAVCAMLFLLLVRLLPEAGSRWPAALGALAFAVHPLNCEPVGEVSYREDLLVAASILLALHAAMSFLKKPGKPGMARNVGLGLLCCVALLFGVSAKENGAAGPVILTAYWLLWRRSDKGLPWALLLGGAWAVVAGFLIARFTLCPAHSLIFVQPPQHLGGSLWAGFLIQLRIWAMEFIQILAPHGLCADYGFSMLIAYSLWLAAPVVAVVMGGMGWVASRGRVFALGAVIFWAGLLPVANFVPLYRVAADRFLYLPMLGLALLLAAGLAGLTPRIRKPLQGGVTLLVAIFAVLTLAREPVWHDSVSLWRATLIDNPDSFTAANNLGWALIDTGDLGGAAQAFQQAVRMSRGMEADTWAGLAVAADRAGQPAAADASFQRAVALDSRYAHPDQLERALIAEHQDAGMVGAVARRNVPAR